MLRLLHNLPREWMRRTVWGTWAHLGKEAVGRFHQHSLPNELECMRVFGAVTFWSHQSTADASAGGGRVGAVNTTPVSGADGLGGSSFLCPQKARAAPFQGSALRARCVRTKFRLPRLRGVLLSLGDTLRACPAHTVECLRRVPQGSRLGRPIILFSLKQTSCPSWLWCARCQRLALLESGPGVPLCT